MSWRLATCVALVGVCSLSCISHDELFTEGKLQTLCGDAIPICSTHASCGLDDDSFYDGAFPGGQRFIVHTTQEHAVLVIRFLLDDMRFPGSEMQVKLFTPDCGAFNEAHPQDLDLFRRAGDDRTLEYELKTTGRGDHLIEIFSDMTAQYLITVEVEE